MEIVLRPAGPTDMAEIITWIPDEQALAYWAGPGKTFPTTAELLWDELGAMPDNAYVLVQAGRLLGFGQIIHHDYSPTLHLARIIVNPSYRGQGFGRILCTQLMTTAVTTTVAGDEVVNTFTLNVHPQNQTAINLYRSLGFRPAAKQHRDDAILMIRPIG